MPWDPRSSRTGTAEHKRWARKVKHRDGYQCQDCGYQGTPGLADVEADHITPISQGGDYSIDNGTTRCLPCHKPKTQHEAAAGRERHSWRRPAPRHPGLIN